MAVELKTSNAPTLTRACFGAIAYVRPRRTYGVTPEAERHPVGEGVEVIGFEALRLELAVP